MKHKTFVNIITIFILVCVIYATLFDTRAEHFDDQHKKIAFLFLIDDNINQENVWNEFFKNVDTTKYNIYIHNKNPTTLKYYEDKKIPSGQIIQDTHWGMSSLVNAMNSLFKYAYENDENNYKFILVSQSCIPLKSFDFIYNELTLNNKGRMDMVKNPNLNSLELKHVEKEDAGKASQWIILNRTAVEILAYQHTNFVKSIFVNSDKFLKEHGAIHSGAPDELYYMTFSNIFNIEDEFEYKTTTLTQFIDDVLGKEEISSSEIDNLYKSEYLFGRKISTNCNVKKNDELVPFYEYTTQFFNPIA